MLGAKLHAKAGWQCTSGVSRPAMSYVRGKGYRAFQDGLRKTECPYGLRTPQAREWHQGWIKAEEYNRKREDKVDR